MPANDLRREALALPDGARAELVTDLLASLDGAADANSESVRLAWAEEIERRALHAVSGESVTESWDSVRQRIADELAS